LIQRVSKRRIEQLWQAYRLTGVLPALKTPGRPRKASISLRDAALILEAYDKLKVNALTLENVLKHTHGLNLPHNRIHMILKENGRAMPQLCKQRRRRWVRYEREHSMSLWHMDWEEGRQLIRSLPRGARHQAYPMPRQPSTNQRQTGTLLRRLRPEAASIQIHRRVRPLAQRNQTPPQPKRRRAGNTHPSLPEETTTRKDRSHPNNSGCEIIMGNYKKFLGSVNLRRL